MRSTWAGRWRWTRYAVIAVAVVMSVATPLGAQRASYTGALYGATGDYIFTRRTTSVWLANGLSLDLGRFRVGACIPLIYQSTPWVAFAGVGPIATGGPYRGEVAGSADRRGRRARHITLPDTGTFDDVGVGDLLFFASADIASGRASWPQFYITGGLKAPVADVEQGFGTGEWDYSAGLGASLLVGRTTLAADASYWVMGDMPDFPLRDIISYSASAGRLLGSGNWMVAMSVLGSGATVEDTDPTAQAGVAVRRVWASGRSVQLSGFVGLTSSSPDVSLSLGWRIPLAGQDDESIVASATHRWKSDDLAPSARQTSRPDTFTVLR